MLPYDFMACTGALLGQGNNCRDLLLVACDTVLDQPSRSSGLQQVPSTSSTSERSFILIHGFERQ